jgi:Flp pilus assembly protein TadD
MTRLEVRAMRRIGWVALLASVAAGCVSTDDQRLYDYNDDGVSLFRRGAYNDAREEFQAALALKPGDANLLYNLGECYDHLRQNEKAEQTYRDCLPQEAGQADAMHALMVLLVR